MKSAVVDVGSNSLILTLFEESESGPVPFFESTRVTGLGKDTKTSGLIQPDRLEASLSALLEFRDLACDRGVARWIAGGTMAVRIAKNSQEFLARAADQGTPVSVVSGDQEARLGFLSVVEDSVLSLDSQVAIVDPGGHSTEITVASKSGSEWAVEFAKSFSFGALGLRETVLTQASPSPGERLATTFALDTQLAEVPAVSGTVVVLGATGTNLVSIRERMVEWQPEKVHGACLEYEEVSRAVQWFCDMDDAGRARIVGLERGRETTIHAGTLALERCLYALKAERCTVSVRGWRHALARHPEIVPDLVVEDLA